MNISTNFMGLKLSNPIIVSACSITGNIKAVKKAAAAGAGAVVLRSLFEEDIVLASKSSAIEHSMHPEAASYVDSMNMLHEPNTYFTFVEEAVNALEIPVIASLNCYTSHWWVDYAERIANVGADAIELNLAPLVVDPNIDASVAENQLLEQVKMAREAVSIPITVKIGFYYSSILNLASKIKAAGANALTLFNRFYKMDIDLEKMEFTSGNSLSSIEEFSTVLRWVGIVSDKVDVEIAASTGIYSSEQLIKVLLAGAQVGQVCSVLYRHGLDSIQQILEGLTEWMEKNQFNSPEDFRGKLSLNQDKENRHYHRLQYVKALKGPISQEM